MTSRINSVLALLVIFVSMAAFAQPKSKQKPTEPKKYAGYYQQGPEFELESNLVDKIYDQTVTSSSADQTITASTLGVKLSLAQFQTVKLSNRYYEVNYSENTDPNPILAFEVSYLFSQVGSAKIYLDWAAGFGYREDIYSATSTEGIAVQDNLSIQVLPLSVAAKAVHRVPKIPISLQASLGGGTQWLKQSGVLDGISQNAWIPFYAYGLNVKFFEPEVIRPMAFSGFALGMTWYQDVSSENDLRATSFDLTSSFYL